MGIDFNAAEEQGTGSGAVPEDSIVMLVASCRSPKAGKEGSCDPLFSKSSTGYEYLDMEFEVMSKTHEGRKIWQNMMLFYTGAATEKSAQAINISMRTLRAIIEASRKIHPKDATPAAVKARTMSAWSDLNGMMFPVVVGCEWGKPGGDGKRYLNNTIKRIITPDDERYEKVYAAPGQELLSDKPLPPEPAAVPPVAAAAAWAAPKTAAPAQASMPGVNATPKPAWAK